MASAVAEAETLRAEATQDAGNIRHDAKLDAERIIAAANRQAADTVAAGQRRAEADVQAAAETRKLAEQALGSAHTEAEITRRRAREEAANLRAEVDAHAQELLARTHDATDRDLAAAREELNDLAARKADLESQLASLRTLLSEAVAPQLPGGIFDMLAAPAPPSPDIAAPLYAPMDHEVLIEQSSEAHHLPGVEPATDNPQPE